jgi:hypothetical protein
VFTKRLLLSDCSLIAILLSSIHLNSVRHLEKESHPKSESVAAMPVNTKKPIGDLETAVLEVARQFKALLQRFDERNPVSLDPLWWQSDAATGLRMRMQGLYLHYHSHMVRLIEHGKLTENDRKFIDECKNLEIQALPDDFRPAWNTLLTTFMTLIPPSTEAYTQRGAEWTELPKNAKA